MSIIRKLVDWEKTGKHLELLRSGNIDLRRSVCGELQSAGSACDGNCGVCEYEMDNHISRKELAKVFRISESVVNNWEKGKTKVSYEDLLLYAQLCKCGVDEIVVFTKEET